MQRMPLADSSGPRVGADDSARLWYATLGDEQVGPLPIAELERMWEDGALARDSLVWKEGMRDWSPLSEVEELGYPLSYPQPGALVVPAKVRPRVNGKPASSEIASGEGIEWKPTAARELSDLAKQEMTQPATACQPANVTPVVPAGMPCLGASPQVSWPAAPALSQAAECSWRVPEAVRTPRGLRPAHLLIGVAGSSIATGVLVLLLLLQPPVPQVAMSAPLPAPTAPPRPAVAPDAPATVPSANGGEQPRSTTASAEEESGRGRRPAGTALKERPSIDEVKDGVKANMESVRECLKRARANSELAPGRYTLILDWQIRSNGTVANGQVKGPASVMGTSLPACFASTMRGWRFPASKSGVPVRNFPFGPFTMR